MRLNTRGEILAGRGRAWLTDDVWMHQVGSDAQGWKTIDSHGEVRDEQGFNDLAAGGGKWATWLNGRGPKGNFGPLDPAGIVLDIGQAGTIAWCPNYQAGMLVAGSVALSTRVCGPNHIVYALANGRVWSSQRGFAAIPAGVVPFRAYLLGDALLYHTHEWLVLQRFDEPTGIVVAAKPAYSPDMIRVPGGYRVVWCLNEGETQTDERIVLDSDLVTDLRGLTDVPSPVPAPAPVPAPVPTWLTRFWFGPNIGSVDLVRLFDDPAVLANVGVFSLYVQEILNQGSAIGPNTFENLQANHLFAKLKQAGIPLAIEMGSIKPGDCHARTALDGLSQAVAKVRAVGGDVAFVSMDEPLTAVQAGCPGQSLAVTADAVTAFIQRGKALGVKVGWIEAWPEVSLETQRALLLNLGTRAALPDYWHLDIDWKRAVKELRSPKQFIADATALAAQYGLTLGVMLAGYDARTDAEYAADVLGLARTLHAIAPAMPHVLVQSWAVRTGGVQDLPKNLGPSGLLATLHQVQTVFVGASPAPVPVPIPPKELTNMIGYSAPVPGFLAGELAPHPDGDGVIVLKPNGAIVAVTPDGAVEERPRGNAGAWEKFRRAKNGASLIAERDGGKFYVFALVE